MKWSVAFATGVPEIDQQHQGLFKASNDYRLALEESCGQPVYETVLRFLEEYAVDHFGFEEQCMHRFRCPVAALNVDAHKQFVRELSRFRAAYERVGYRDEDAVALVNFVDEWLASHIAGIDIHLKPCVAAAEGGHLSLRVDRPAG